MERHSHTTLVHITSVDCGNFDSVVACDELYLSAHEAWFSVLFHQFLGVKMVLKMLILKHLNLAPQGLY